MWELSKTPYDNARFFPETYPLDVASWVRRDRCHPSVILWSIGNEIYDMQASDRGQYWTKMLMDEVRRHDTRHAAVTFASNYMPWEGAQKCADIIKLPGYNYAERYYAVHHAQHPDWVIFGSETGSLLASRGIYHFPMKETILSEEDLQCSALLNSNTSWGAQDLRKMLVEDRLNPYTLGQFIWSGIDYIGEPTPYHTRNCYFGQTDTACFPKDAYYFYQAMWTDAPMIHIGIYWDWNEGQLIDVPVMTNGAAAELFLNG
jgi:beta-galactosidase